MVIRILTGKDVREAVRYNEKKVEQGQAETIHIANYPDAKVAARHAQYRLDLLQQYTRLNSNVNRPSVHLAIAFHPSETLTGEQLQQIGSEVMTAAGYGRQPYLMYQHRDTQHPHVHIVSVSVDGRGNKICDAFMKRRLQQVRRRLEIKYDLVQAENSLVSRTIDRVGEGAIANQRIEKSVSDRLSQLLSTYSFGSIDSLKQYLKNDGIEMNQQAGRSQTGITYRNITGTGADNRPVKASSLPSQPTHRRLIELFAKQAEQHSRGCKLVAGLLNRQLSTYRNLTETDYKQSLRQVGIELIETDGVYLYIEKRAGVIAQEAEIGTPYTRGALLKRFTGEAEQWPVVLSQTVDHNESKQAGKKADSAAERIRIASASGRSRTGSLKVTPRESVESDGTNKPIAGEIKTPEPSAGLNDRLTKEEPIKAPFVKKKKKNQANRLR